MHTTVENFAQPVVHFQNRLQLLRTVSGLSLAVKRRQVRFQTSHQKFAS